MRAICNYRSRASLRNLPGSALSLTLGALGAACQASAADDVKASEAAQTEGTKLDVNNVSMLFRDGSLPLKVNDVLRAAAPTRSRRTTR